MSTVNCAYVVNVGQVFMLDVNRVKYDLAANVGDLLAFDVGQKDRRASTVSRSVFIVRSSSMIESHNEEP